MEIDIDSAREINRRDRNSKWAKALADKLIARKDMRRAARALDLWAKLDLMHGGYVTPATDGA